MNVAPDEWAQLGNHHCSPKTGHRRPPRDGLVTASGKPPRILHVALIWQHSAFGIVPYLLYDVSTAALSSFGAPLINGSTNVNLAK